MPFKVYKIANSVNEKLYIGYTAKTLEERFEDHWHSHHSYRSGKCNTLYTAMREIGFDKFSIHLLEENTNEWVIKKAERDWIHQLNTADPYGYNKCVRKLTDEEVAIVKFDAYKLHRKEYAAMFSVSVATIHNMQREVPVGFRNDPYAYITREHLPISLRTSP